MTRSLLQRHSESPCCPVCMVYYTPGYAGPCQEFHRSASDKQIAAGTARRCPGVVSLDAAVQAQRERAERAEELLRIAREATRYALDDHHLNGDECLCDAARSTLAAGLSLTEEPRHA